MSHAANALSRLYAEIAAVCVTCGRAPESVRVIGASKQKTASELAPFVAAGLHELGENYQQDFFSKKTDLERMTETKITWHFIGRIQSNKISALNYHVAWMHSVATLKHAKKISEASIASRKVMNVLLQVNTSGEISKDGVAPEQLSALLSGCNGLSGIHVRGLMTMPPPVLDPEQARPYFRRLRELRDEMNQRKEYATLLTELSMGMSADYGVAIAEGATMIRIGQSLFGARPKPQEKL